MEKNRRFFQESKATWTIPVLWWAREPSTRCPLPLKKRLVSTGLESVTPRLGGFAVEKKVPLNNKCRLEVLDVVTILYPNSPKLCESPVPIRENKHVPPWKSTFHVFWSQMMAESLGVSLLLQVRLPSLQSLEKQLEARCFVQTKTDPAGHQKWFLKW